MGLLDALQGMMNGPRGAVPSTSQGGRSGMSPVTMGLLALLAYKAIKGRATPSAAPNAAPSGGGGLMNWLGGGVGGALAGGTAGSIVNGGLSELVNRFQQNGLGNVASSWIGNGPNHPISEGDIEKVAGSDTLDELAKELGIPRSQLLERLRSELPQAVDHLSPQGRVPTQQEASQMVQAN